MLSGGVDKQHPTVIALAEKLRVSWLTAQASNTFALVKLKKKKTQWEIPRDISLNQNNKFSFPFKYTVKPNVSNTLKPIN